MVDYIAAVIVPYMKEKRKHLGLDSKHVGLVILDKFKEQTTDKVLNLLQTNDLMYVIVPPNCTDRLQPLDVSVNRAAKQFLRNKFENWYADQIIGSKGCQQGNSTCGYEDVHCEACFCKVDDQPLQLFQEWF